MTPPSRRFSTFLLRKFFLVPPSRGSLPLTLFDFEATGFLPRELSSPKELVVWQIPPNFRPQHVLVVDGYQDMCETLRLLIRMWGHANAPLPNASRKETPP